MTDLTSIEDLDNAINNDSYKAIVLFKHSTRCPISMRANDQYLEFAKQYAGEDILFTHLDLLAHRDVSSAIAEKTGIEHQSPQAIVLVDGKAKLSATHNMITVDSLAGAIKSLEL